MVEGLLVNKYLNFNNFNLKKNILRILSEIGYKKPTKIQIKCIPLFLKGYDILGVAKTGSGKTASFVLPVLNNIILNVNFIQVLVLTPTRELTIQITNSFIKFSKYIKVKILSLYGGQKYSIQLNNLKKKPNIIVGTPGRLLDHIRRNTLNISNIKTLIIDEADEMFRMGFIKDVENIIFNIKSNHQTALFSATMPISIKNIVNKFMNSPKEIFLDYKNKSNILPKNIKQYFCFIPKSINKLNVLVNFLEIESFNTVIIFVRTKIYTIKLSNYIKSKGYNCSPFNGDMNQNLREKVLDDLRNSKINILVATDVASRGLDIRNINLVINYDIPFDIEIYIHRIGRTGRAGDFGKTILFVNNKERYFLYSLQRYTNSVIKKISIPDENILKKIRKIKLINYLQKYINIDKKNENYFLYKNIILNLIKVNSISFEKISCILLKIIYERKFNISSRW